MTLGAVICLAVAFLVGLVVGRIWGGAAARREGNMLPTRLASAPPHLVSTSSSSNVAADALTDAEFEEEIKRLASVNLINAIKLYRERKGCGLKEAKDAVDQLRWR